MTVTFYTYDLNQDMMLTAEHLLNKSVRFFINWDGAKATERSKVCVTWSVPTSKETAIKIIKQFQLRLYRIHAWNNDQVGIYDFEWTLGD